MRGMYKFPSSNLPFGLTLPARLLTIHLSTRFYLPGAAVDMDRQAIVSSIRHADNRPNTSIAKLR